MDNARGKENPTAKQRRVRTYAEQVERAFGCSLDDLYENDGHDYGFDHLPRLGFERSKWLAALRGAYPALMDEVGRQPGMRARFAGLTVLKGLATLRALGSHAGGKTPKGRDEIRPLKARVLRWCVQRYERGKSYA